MNREGWLTELADRMRPVFKDFTLGKFRVTCGWPAQMALSPTRKRVGECHGPASSTDGHAELFISPVLAKPIEVAGVLCHEMAHVVAGVKAAHGKGFVRVIRHIGLTQGKPTSADLGPILKARVEKLLSTMGSYPHAAMTPVAKVSIKMKSVTVLECECGCRITMSLKMIELYGPPTCACGSELKPIKD